MSNNKQSQKITLILSNKLLAGIEAAAKASYCTRSDYIRAAAVGRLKQEQSIDKAVESKSQTVVTQSEDEFLAELERRYS